MTEIKAAGDSSRRFAKSLTLIALASLVLLSGRLLAALEPTREVETISRLASAIISKRHYAQRPIDNRLSEELFDEYFKTLDPNKMFFSKKDIDKFAKFRDDLDDQLLKGNLSFAFDVYNLYVKRLEDYDVFCKSFLAKPVDFSKDEEFDFNRTKADWLPDEDALKDFWRKKIKNDILSLMILDRAKKEDPGFAKRPSDKNVHPSWGSDAPPAERVKRRIDKFIQESKKSDPIDVLELYLLSLAHIYDPHSGYMAPNSAEDFNISMKLSLVGIGAVLSSENGYTKIEKIIPGGPAEAEGSLAPGDRIVAVAQEGGEPVDVMDMRLSKVVNLIRGPKGSKVALTVLKGSKGLDALPVQIVIKRDTVMLKESEAKGDIKEFKDASGRTVKIGVITLPSFYMDFDAASKGVADYKSSTRDVAKLLAFFKKQGVDGVVMDLRSNGGGSLFEAISLTGLFIKSGPVVQVRSVSGVDVKEDDDDGAIAYEGPLAVMVNRLSASATEIFAAAIKDYNRGIIIGDSKTHGKGTVQTVLELNDFLAFIGQKFPAGDVKFTNAKFYRINGSSTQLKGVTPDIVFPSFTDSMELGEERLEHALPWDRINPARYKVVDERIPGLLNLLRERSDARVAASKDFKALSSEISQFARLREKKTISLNFEKRWNEYLVEKKLQDEQSKLMRLGDDDLDIPSSSAKDAKDAAKKKEDADLYLKETLNIMADFVAIMDKRPLPKAPPPQTAARK